MDCKKVGEIISNLRREKGFSQVKLAKELNISNRTVSKWERGLGCPDVDILCELSTLLGVNIESIISGQLKENNALNGNMKKSKLYYCPTCGNLIVALGEADIVCCGKKLYCNKPKATDAEHALTVTPIEDEWYIESTHPMTKEHYITSVLMLSDESLQEIKLFPEQSLSVRFKRRAFSSLYFICNTHGLYKQDIIK